MRALLSRLMIPVSLVAGLAVATALADQGTAQAAVPACGTVLLSGSSWLGGAGVDVHSNGAYQGTGTSCGSFSQAHPTVQDGYAWQCVELASRLYYVKGWGTVRAGGNGGAVDIPEGSPSLTFHTNGSGYAPVQGDLIIFNATSSNPYGHVAVVDSVGGGRVNDAEENGSTSGRGNLTISGSTISGNVRGVEHSPKNTAGGGGLPSTWEVAFQANTSALWAVGSDNRGSLGYGMMTGTSPSITTLSNGGWEAAFQANTGVLWVVGSDNRGSLGYGMMRGTSPSITRLSNGGWEAAFQANTGVLWVVGSDNRGSLGYGMMRGTSPAITATANGGWEVAFQANTSALWAVGSDSRGSLGYGMMRGTSPSITGTAQGWEAAFQANTGVLWAVGSDNRGSLGYGMMTGTSPSITTLSNGGWEAAFQANTSALWAVGSDSRGSLGYGMMRGTSPSITGTAQGWEAAFQANTGVLWAVGSDNRGSLGYGMMTGTSPAIAAV
jgi:hypothetical protein